MNKEKVLVLFSGGLDSMLTTCKIVEEGYHAVLVHYDNGSSKGSSNVYTAANRLIERYGSNLVSFWGIGKTVGYFKVLRDVVWNMSTKELAQKYPELYPYQFICLACRTAMYIYSILLCKKLNISIIAEGARKSQLFAIEQDSMLKKYQDLLNEYGIQLLTPVLELENDYEREIELLMRSISPSTLEPQCYLGVPMKEKLTEREEQEVVNVYSNELEALSKKLIKKSEKIDLDPRGKLF